MELQNDLLIRAANGAQVERPPVWVMRQAGRILKEYREIRNSLSGFRELVMTPELAAEVTIQPVDILGVDAAIIFSDILVVPEALGLPYEMIEKKGPFFPKTISSRKDIENLRVVDPEKDLGYVSEAIKITKERLNGRVPLIGFAGAPWTIFSYMIEGGGSKTFSKARKFLYQNPEESHLLLQRITDTTIAYLKTQIESGANLVQVFDSWASILPKDQYLEFGLAYIDQICQAIHEVPVTVFAKGAWNSLKEQGELDCQTIGLDWNISPEFARSQVGSEKVLQGNLDPCLLYADKDTIKRKTEQMIRDFGNGKHIANLGHGVYPDTDPARVKAFIDTVKGFQY